ncbi:unnamed protein product [Phytomonas sp. Hart1]|nr:unnamed protein product [Phytomonas sp. Hart1]|eukprot:CCW69499.1 unnamed protein product [Phytomonas sp. isolate Hart1]
MSEKGDDLDLLLDEAMNIVDQQEKEHEETVRLRDAKLQEDLQRTLEETSAMSGSGMPNGDILKIFQSILGAAGSDEDDTTSMENFKRDVGALVKSLEDVDGLNKEDMENLDRVRNLMSVLDTDDDARTQELLEEMKSKDLTLGLDNLDVENANVEDVMKCCVESLQQFTSATEGPLNENTEAVSLEASKVPEATASNPQSSTGTFISLPSLGDVPENIANMLLDTILNSEFVEPIKLMRDSYEPYLVDKTSKLSEVDLERYHAQHAMAKKICDFLVVPIDKDDHDRITQLLELMYEFSNLGEPPADLTEYSPNKRTTSS